MTREEAIQVLSHIIQVADTSDCGIKEIDGTDEEAIKMAIKALEQCEPCEDCISRKAVMDCFKKWQPYMATRIFDFENELKSLPSVQPKTDTLDKIRAEIAEFEERIAELPNMADSYATVRHCLDIVDKYRKEQE